MTFFEMLSKLLVGDLGAPDAQPRARPYLAEVAALRAELSLLRDEIASIRGGGSGPSVKPPQPGNERLLERIDPPSGTVARKAKAGERIVIISADPEGPFHLGESLVVASETPLGVVVHHARTSSTYQIGDEHYAVVADRWTRKIPEGQTVFDAVDAEAQARGESVPPKTVSPSPGVYGDPTKSFPGNVCVPPPSQDEVNAAIMSLIEAGERATQAAIGAKIRRDREAAGLLRGGEKA